MKHIIAMMTVVGLLASPAGWAGEDMQQMKKMAVKLKPYKAAIKSYAMELQGELKTAMKAGGPLEALTVCNEKAAEITANFSEKHPFDISRVSLKPRNPDHAPDSWEKAVLKQFEAKKAEGENPKKMAHYEVIEEDGQKVLRFMKAIPTSEVCLTCHGKDIPESIAEKLDELYPEDQARGYSVGDIRGAFSITETLE